MKKPRITFEASSSNPEINLDLTLATGAAPSLNFAGPNPRPNLRPQIAAGRGRRPGYHIQPPPVRGPRAPQRITTSVRPIHRPPGLYASDYILRTQNPRSPQQNLAMIQPYTAPIQPHGVQAFQNAPPGPPGFGFPNQQNAPVQPLAQQNLAGGSSYGLSGIQVPLVHLSSFQQYLLKNMAEQESLRRQAQRATTAPSEEIPVLTYARKNQRSSVVITPIEEASSETADLKGKGKESTMDLVLSSRSISDMLGSLEGESKLKKVSKENEGASGAMQVPTVIQEDVEKTDEKIKAITKPVFGVWTERLPRPTTPANREDIERDVAAKHYKTMERMSKEYEEQLFQRNLSLMEKDEIIAMLKKALNEALEKNKTAEGTKPTPYE